MIRAWLIRLLQGLTGEAARPTGSRGRVLSIEMGEYAQALAALEDNPHALLAVLQARDGVEEARQEVPPLRADEARRLIALDGRLREGGTSLALEELPAWRQSLRPSQTAWWWFLDQPDGESERERDMPWTWVVLTGLLVFLTVALTAEILKRLWAGAPDAFSVFGTLLTLALTTSPLLDRGQALGRWALDRLPRVQPRIRGEAMTGMAAMALLIVLAGWLLLPQLAVIYNNQGVEARDRGNLTNAERRFQRAIALDPDLVVPYYNLADVYGQIERPEEAMTWYQQAIKCDLDFAPAYQGLGHLHNEGGDHEQAEGILVAGLQRMGEHLGERTAVATRYDLLSDLGWAYFAQGKYDLAREALEEAVALEPQLEQWEKEEEEDGQTRYRKALPHYYLAQIYERLDRATEARGQWEDCERLLPSSWEWRAWDAVVDERLEALEAERP